MAVGGGVEGGAHGPDEFELIEGGEGADAEVDFEGADGGDIGGRSGGPGGGLGTGWIGGEDFGALGIGLGAVVDGDAGGGREGAGEEGAPLTFTRFGGGDDAGITGEREDVDEDDVFHGDVAAVADGEAVIGLATGDGVADVGEAEPLGVELAADVFEGFEGGGAGDEVGRVVSGDLFGAIGVAIDVVGIGDGIVVGDGAELGGGVDGEEAVDGVVGAGGAVFDAGIEFDGRVSGDGEGVGVAPAEEGATCAVVVG